MELASTGFSFTQNAHGVQSLVRDSL
jgi:hypothetical protein